MVTRFIDTSFVPQLVKLPYRHVWSDYDTEADVLYLSFRKPQGADDTIMESDGNLYHYRGKELVGITILNASQPQTARRARPLKRHKRKV